MSAADKKEEAGYSIQSSVPYLGGTSVVTSLYYLNEYMQLMERRCSSRRSHCTSTTQEVLNNQLKNMMAI